MKKEEKKVNLKEETTELKPETEGCVKLTDEQMEQVTGGARPEVEPGIEIGSPPSSPSAEALNLFVSAPLS